MKIRIKNSYLEKLELLEEIMKGKNIKLANKIHDFRFSLARYKKQYFWFSNTNVLAPNNKNIVNTKYDTYVATRNELEIDLPDEIYNITRREEKIILGTVFFQMLISLGAEILVGLQASTLQWVLVPCYIPAFINSFFAIEVIMSKIKKDNMEPKMYQRQRCLLNEIDNNYQQIINNFCDLYYKCCKDNSPIELLALYYKAVRGGYFSYRGEFIGTEDEDAVFDVDYKYQYDIINGFGCCRHNAALFHDICLRLGFDSKKICALLIRDGEKDGHAFNLVNGHYIDPTWNDLYSYEDGKMRFLKNRHITLSRKTVFSRLIMVLFLNYFDYNNKIDNSLDQLQYYEEKLNGIEPKLKWFYDCNKKYMTNIHKLLVEIENPSSEYLLEIIEKIPEYYVYLDDSLKQDINYVSNLLLMNPNIYNYLDETLKNNDKIKFYYYIGENVDKFFTLPEELQTREMYIWLLKGEKIKAYRLCEKFKDDEEIVALYNSYNRVSEPETKKPNNTARKNMFEDLEIECSRKNVKVI